MMTLLNINNTDRFFSIVDGCAGPVTVQSSDGRKEDLRHNALLRDLLTSSGDGSIAKIDLDCTDAGDASRMFKYMLEGA